MTPQLDPSQTFDVAIIGLGPVGATLANLLGLCDLRVLVLEREADVYRLPRAIHFDGECMRVFQTIGIADELFPDLFVAPGMRFIDADGNLLIDWQRGSAEPGPQAWHRSYRFHQPTLELLLRRRLGQRANVDVRLRHEAFSIEPHGDHVQVRVEDLSTGRLSSARARYVVGCDGARSIVRRFMGTEFEDLRSHDRWLVVDVVLKRDRPDLGEYSIQYCDPRRPVTYVRGPGSRRRWEIMLMPGDDPAIGSKPPDIWRLLDRWITPDDAELERPAVYTFHSVLARGWRRGRLLIAGDAAHQTPPFMGQGMCAGIRDVANLAWKLGEVVSGRFRDELLDTYESERSPHARVFIETAVWMGTVIQAMTPEAIARRNAEMLNNPRNFTTPEPALGPGCHTGDGRGGWLSSQPLLRDGGRLDDLHGYRPALIVTAPLADSAWRLLGEEIASRMKVHVTQEPSVLQWLASLEAEAVLLRPDRYVFGTATDPRGLRTLVDRWFTHA
jgi:3-(3-hydroxy-phenyl)propionate hydroxylase